MVVERGRGSVERYRTSHSSVGERIIRQDQTSHRIAAQLRGSCGPKQRTAAKNSIKRKGVCLVLANRLVQKRLHALACQQHTATSVLGGGIKALSGTKRTGKRAIAFDLGGRALACRALRPCEADQPEP
eukprot:1159396-Rhodomonas_salina.1